MEKVAQIFSSFEEAEEAENRYYARLSPQERMAILLELVSPKTDDSQQRLKRVYRITPLAQS